MRMSNEANLGVAFHHVNIDVTTGQVVSIHDHDQELRTRSRLKELTQGGGAYRKAFLSQGDSYTEVFTPGQQLEHGVNDGTTHKPGER